MTSIITLRIQDDIKRMLEEESLKLGINTTTLISKILKKHVEWTRFTENMRFILLPRQTYKQMLQYITDNHLTQLAKTTHVELKTLNTFMTGEYNIDTMLKVLTYWLETSYIQIRYMDDTNTKKIIINHELGSKYTSYFQSLLSNLTETLDIPISFELDENYIIADIRTKKQIHYKL